MDANLITTFGWTRSEKYNVYMVILYRNDFFRQFRYSFERNRCFGLFDKKLSTFIKQKKHITVSIVFVFVHDKKKITEP